MSQSNQRTIEAYDKNVEKYARGANSQINGMVGDSVRVWLDGILDSLNKDAKILEIGSGLGIDADYIEEKGYRVERTDASVGFVQRQRDAGKDAEKLDILAEDIPNGYDLIYANAVLLHFTRDEARAVFHKVSRALEVGGRFAFTLIEGEGDKWSTGKLGDERYFCYWQEDEVRAALHDSGFVVLDLFKVDFEDKIWLYVIAGKG